jgi:hypothetical protein
MAKIVTPVVGQLLTIAAAPISVNSESLLSRRVVSGLRINVEACKPLGVSTLTLICRRLPLRRASLGVYTGTSSYVNGARL